MSEDWCDRVKKVVSEFDFSPLVAQLVAIESELPVEQKAHLAALKAAEEICRKVVAGFPVEDVDAIAAEPVQIAVISELIGREPIEIRAWRDLLDPERVGAFSNRIPETVFASLRREAESILSASLNLKPEVRLHLENFVKGKSPAPIWTENWRQWMNLNVEVVNDPEYPRILLAALAPVRLPQNVRNFLEAQVKVNVI